MAKQEIIPQSNDICRISKGTSIVGTITSSSDIRFDGALDGTVYTKGKLVIGESSKIKGKVFCNSCDLWGNVDGEVYVEDLINLKSNSVLSGSLKSPKVGIEVGAIFNGMCNIITKEAYSKYLHEVVALPAKEGAPAAHGGKGEEKK